MTIDILDINDSSNLGVSVFDKQLEFPEEVVLRIRRKPEIVRSASDVKTALIAPILYHVIDEVGGNVSCVTNGPGKPAVV